ncbi:MAG: hypothetical protein D6732_07535 [Methanobacteriota archaeon]|nr:MAG: hypothetical protein D6732_07535 [Euryarchaeota archaeon]
MWPGGGMPVSLHLFRQSTSHPVSSDACVAIRFWRQNVPVDAGSSKINWNAELATQEPFASYYKDKNAFVKCLS